jgi:hypothetical protein
MIRHVWSVLCSSSVIDVQSNNISLYNTLEQITIKDNPKPDGVLPFNFHIVSSWIRSDSNIPATGLERISFLDPLGKKTGSIELPINLSEHERARNRFEFSGLPASKPGRHIFLVEYRLENNESNWHSIAEIPLTIIFQPKESEIIEDKISAIEETN